MPDADWVGKDLVCALKDKTQIKGEVYTYDKDSDTLVVKDHAVGLQEANYRFLKGKDIDPASVKLTGTSRMPDPTPAVSDSTVDRLRHKEKDVVRTEMSKAHNIGEGVTEFAQHIFNGLNKTMKCHWEGKTIIAAVGGAEDAVRIADPYGTANVQAANDKTNPEMVERVKKVLQGETERIRQGG